MEIIDSFRTSDWDTAFHSNDCTNTTLILFGLANIKTIIWLIYVSLAICTGFMYGRHKAIDPHKLFDEILNNKDIESKLIKYASACWFILSTFIFPWYLCTIWLYYSIHFNDIHYMNTYNPWILPIIVTYMFYSITVIISFAYYSHSHNRCSYICVKITFILYGLLALFVLYILKKNINNNLSNFSLNGFYGNNMLHCVDFASHKNPIIISIFIIIYVYVTHHIFVCLRAFAAKFCGGEYLSETQFENDNQKRIKMEQKKHRNYAYVYDKNNKSDGNEFQIDINQSKSVDISEYDEYVDSEEDECHFNGYYMRSRSDSRQNGNKRKSQYLNEPNAGTPEPQLLDMPNQV